MKNELEKREKKSGESFATKVSSVSKKVVGGISQGVKNLSESSQKKQQEKKMRKLNPLFPETFKSESFHIPNVINIVDDAVRRDIEECRGAIGWTETVEGVEVLCLYDEYIEESGLKFMPFAACDAVYCIDTFEKGKFINTDIAFERTLNEKLAELEQVAYCLGAKSCSIEIVDLKTSTTKVDVSAKMKVLHTNIESKTEVGSRDEKTLKTVTHFEGNEKTKQPKLKWFACDENVIGLIEMRRAGKNMIKSKVLELYCATSATMSNKSAIAIDKIKGIKGKNELSVTVKTRKEHNSKLIFKIEF